MSCYQPPFNGADIAASDGCGFFIPGDQVTPDANIQRGSFTIPKNAQKVTAIFDQPLPLGTKYDIEVWTENQKTGDPDEQIYPTTLVSRNNDGASEVGFTYLLNSPPSTGPGTFGTNGENSYTQFNWAIKTYA